MTDRERAALAVLAKADGPMWPGRVGFLAGDDRPGWRVGHSWRNTLFALERKGWARGVTRGIGQVGQPHTEFEITDAGREAYNAA